MNGSNSLACTPPAPTVQYPGYCGIGAYNFSTLANGPDVYGTIGTNTIFIRLCGAVSQVDCVRAGGHNVQICQWGSSTNVNTISTLYNPNGQETTFNYTNGVDGSQGISFVINDGTYCSVSTGVYAREAFGNITCGTTNAITNFFESSTRPCNYYMTLTSPLACPNASSIIAAPPTQQMFSFCYITYTSLSEIINNVNFNNWASVTSGYLVANQTTSAGVYSVVGINAVRNVASTNGLATIVSTSTVTAIESPSTCYGGCDNYINYPFNPSYNSYFVNGLTIDLTTAQTDGSGCSGSSITIRSTATSQCSNGVTNTNSRNSFTLAAFNSTVNAASPIPCNPPTTAIPLPGYCGIGQYNFTSFATGPDLNFTRSNGEVLYVRLCGAVSQPNCVANYGTNVQICQWESTTLQYVLSALNAPNGETTFNYTNGVDATAGINFTIADGATCTINSVTYNRQARGQLVCGPVNNITQYYETSTSCIYLFIIQTPLVCVPSNSSSTGSSVSIISSSAAVAPFVPVTTSFGLCAIAYTSNIISETPGESIWTSVTSAIITTNSTSTPGVFQVTSVSGYRLIASNDGLSTVASNVTISGLVPNSSQCLGCNNVLYYTVSGGTSYSYNVDASGLTFALSANQTDNTGCSGGLVRLSTGSSGLLETCPTGSSSNAVNSISVNMLSASTPTPPSCAVPTSPSIPSFTCGIGPYNFSSLATGPDLTVPSTPSGYIIYVRLCGAVSFAQCVNAFGRNSQVCQTNTGQYEVAALNAPNGEISFTYTNGANANAGINFTIADGGSCNINGNIYPRSVIGLITCGATNNATFFAESATPCIYTLTMTSPLACVSSSSGAAAPTSSATSSLSSSLRSSSVLSSSVLSSSLPSSSSAAITPIAVSSTASSSSATTPGTVSSSSSLYSTARPSLSAGPSSSSTAGTTSSTGGTTLSTGPTTLSAGSSSVSSSSAGVTSINVGCGATAVSNVPTGSVQAQIVLSTSLTALANPASFISELFAAFAADVNAHGNFNATVPPSTFVCNGVVDSNGVTGTTADADSTTVSYTVLNNVNGVSATAIQNQLVTDSQNGNLNSNINAQGLSGVTANTDCTGASCSTNNNNQNNNSGGGGGGLSSGAIAGIVVGSVCGCCILLLILLLCFRFLNADKSETRTTQQTVVQQQAYNNQGDQVVTTHEVEMQSAGHEYEENETM